ncbi:MAG: hypothetical protein HDR03_01590 [Lachnospiraceae bacterium]|nr:hypothetical protein [Lachnospiraceae bacterium]
MDKMDFQEKLWGGIFGIIAIVAAIGEAVAGGLSVSSVFGAIKDVSGTLIVVVLLVTFVKQLPRKPKNIVEKLEKRVEDWGMANAPLIFKAQEYVAAKDSLYTQGYVLLQNPRDYVKLANINKEDMMWSEYAKYGNNRKTGKFLDMPAYMDMTRQDFSVLIVMEQSHFKNMDGIDEIVDDIKNAVEKKFDGRCGVSRSGKSLKLVVNYRKVETEQDIDFFVDTIDYILSLVKVIA